MKLPQEREDKNWDSVPPPGHSTCGGNKVSGYSVDQETWDAIFGDAARSEGPQPKPVIAPADPKVLGWVDVDDDEQGELVPA